MFGSSINCFLLLFEWSISDSAYSLLVKFVISIYEDRVSSLSVNKKNKNWKWNFLQVYKNQYLLFMAFARVLQI